MFIKNYYFKFIKLFILLGLLNNYESYSKELVFCHDEIESFPWFEQNGNGLNTVEMNLVDEKLEDIEIKQQSLPWLKCLRELKENKIDGVFAASFSPERLEIGVYPGIPLDAKDGIPDESKRMHISEYALYKKKGSQIKCDGSRISGAKRVGAQSGFSILTLLKKQKEQKNIEFIDESEQSSNALIYHIAKGNLDAVAMLSLQADKIIKSNKDFSNIEKIEPALEKKAYYLILSHKLVKEDPELANKISKTLQEVRNSTEYKAKVKEIFKKYF